MTHSPISLDSTVSKALDYGLRGPGFKSRLIQFLLSFVKKCLSSKSVKYNFKSVLYNVESVKYNAKSVKYNAKSVKYKLKSVELLYQSVKYRSQISKVK